MMCSLQHKEHIQTVCLQQSGTNTADIDRLYEFYVCGATMLPASRNSITALLIVSSVFCALLRGVAAHGSLITPRPRNWQVQLSPGWWSTNYANRVNGAENFGNGHGPNGPKPAAGPDVCGDPWQHWNSNYAGMSNLPIQATYGAGATIDVRWLISANHGGRIGFKLCPNGRAGLTQACFDAHPLERADGLGRFYYILDGTTNGGQAIWYGEMTGRFRLPAGVSCPNGCVLQWEYLTMNSCYPADIGSCPAAACGVYRNRQNPVTRSGNMGNCCLGASCNPAVIPEVFRNCADIVITGSGGPGPVPPVPSPSTPRPPSPSPKPPAPGCNDNRADCTAWGPGLCNVPGVATLCPCMCGRRAARINARNRRNIPTQAAAAAAAAAEPTASQAAAAEPASGAIVESVEASQAAVQAAGTPAEVHPLATVYLTPPTSSDAASDSQAAAVTAAAVAPPDAAVAVP